MKAVRIFVDKLPEFTDDQVECVYRGEPDTCMCGCSGDYFYTQHNRVEAGQSRGYDIGDNEINDNKVKEIADMFRQARTIENIDNYIFTILRKNKQYTLYFLKPLAEPVTL